MTKDTLWRLRMEIRLCSLYYADYRNSFGIDRHAVCDFFDGYADFLEELMREEIPDYNDAGYFDRLPQYDNAENLWAWYGCFDEEPLPLPVEPDEESA